MPVYENSEWRGTGTITAPSPVTAGMYGTWRVEYCVGVSGIDDGRSVRLSFRSDANWATPQFADPAAKTR